MKNTRRAIIRKDKAPKTNWEPCGDHLGAALSAHDRKPEKVRLGGKWIHVSALVNGECLRAIQIAHRDDLVAHVKPRPSDRLLWAIGKAVEAHIRGGMITLYGRENVMGLWKCDCGETSHEGFGDGGASSCKTCKTPLHNYSEYNVKNEDSMLSGSPDILVRKGSTKNSPLTVCEIKSIKVVGKGGVRNATPEFHTLEHPVRGHSLQALMYRALLEREGFNVTDEVIICYGAKDYVMESPYKFFTVDGTSDENVLAVESLLTLAEQYAQSDGKLLPRLGLCPNATTPKAKSCHCTVPCFASRS